jgi:hypothetical protein
MEKPNPATNGELKTDRRFLELTDAELEPQAGQGTTERESKLATSRFSGKSKSVLGLQQRG